jgi:hypothetical protein
MTIPGYTGGWHVDGQDYMTDFIPAYPPLMYVCGQWVRHQALAESGVRRLFTEKSLHLQFLGSYRTRTSWLRLSAKVEKSPYGKMAVPGKYNDGTDALY